MCELVAQPLDVGEDLALARHIERRERLVHQQDARLGEQRAPDRDALSLAAGQRCRPAAQQRVEPEQRDDPRRLDERGRPAGTAAVRTSGSLHVEMRKKQRILEHVANARASGGTSIRFAESNSASH